MSDGGQPHAGFYESLASFDDFDGFADAARYRPLPDGWRIVVADIRGSTKAIAEGRYKDVNMMGAACIAAVLNALKSFDPVPAVPYVFGGDGATLAIPDDAADTVRDALIRTRALSEGRFGLEMRIGLVPIADIRARGHDVLVARFRLSPGNHIAMFSGGGVELAEHLVKNESDGALYRVDAGTAPAFPDLDGLSCRWAPIRARHGKIVSLLVRAPLADGKARAALYRKVLARMSAALGRDFGALSPASDASLRFCWPPSALWTEARATAAGGMLAVPRRAAFILAQSALQWALHRFGRRAGSYDAPVYKLELIANTDFRRFDDTLRLVLDCSTDQAAALETCLADLRREDGVIYGLHVAETALMTCLVFSLEDSEHVHFIDGGDGGFALAAQRMKMQSAA